MSEIFCYLSGFFTGVGVACAAFCVYLHRIRRQLAEARERLREVIETLQSCGDEGEMRRLVDLKTFIPERGVWVSTVAYDEEIGFGRCAETMVFKGDESGITDWSELYFESHGYITDEEELKKRHKEIVRKIREGEIEV